MTHTSTYAITHATTYATSHANISRFCTLVVLPCITPVAHAFSGSAELGWLMLFVLIASLAVALGLAFALAWLLSALLKRLGKPTSVKSIAAILSVLFIVIGITWMVGIMANEGLRKRNSYMHSQAAQKLLCEADATTIARELPQHVGHIIGRYYVINVYTEQCIIQKGSPDRFRAVVGAMSTTLKWHKAKVPPTEYCEWVKAAINTKNKDFIAALHANQLPLVCQGDGLINKQTLAPWFSLFDKVPPEEHVGWMQFLLQNGAKLDTRDATHNTIADYAERRGWSELSAYLLSIEAKPGQDKATPLPTTAK